MRGTCHAPGSQQSLLVDTCARDCCMQEIQEFEPQRRPTLCFEELPRETLRKRDIYMCAVWGVGYSIYFTMIFPPVYTQPNQCPCRYLLERRALLLLLLLWSQTARRRCTLQIQQGDLDVCSSHETDIYFHQFTSSKPVSVSMPPRETSPVVTS